jgi:hypothetical protein
VGDVVVKRLAWLGLALSSCSLLVGPLTDCVADGDCASKGGGLICVDRLCVKGTSAPQDAGCEAQGCYACAPETSLQYLNACTSAAGQCIAFDARRITRLADGGLPPLPEAVVTSDAGSSVADAGPAPTPDAGAMSAVDAGPPSCELSDKPTVYVVGSSAAKPFLAALGRALRGNSEPINVVYQSQGSCVGVDDVLNGKTIAGNATQWDPSSPNVNNEVTCRIAAPTVPDIAISDVFAQTCFSLPNGLPPSVGEFFGPVQTMTFVVPTASRERSISAEAAYVAYGFGADSNLEPWTNPAVLLRRNTGSGTQALVATALGMPPSALKGVDTGSSTAMITKVASSTSPLATLGILADTDITETVSLSIRVLAYQHYGQTCGYLPDSSSGSKDKKNVRDGHYALWGPLHLLSPADPSTGFARNVSARRLISYISGTTEPPAGLDLIQVEAVNNLVPTCAMNVTRTREMGAYGVRPTTVVPCGCQFERTATGATSCQTCTTAADCPSKAPTCSRGYCEP